MKYSTKTSDAVHMLVYIQLGDSVNLTSQAIATSIQTNPGCVRQNMMKLKKAGLLNSVPGTLPLLWRKHLPTITLYDIYRAMEGDKPLLHLDTHVNPACGVGVNVQYALKDYYDEIQAAAEAKMKTITLEDIIQSFNQRLAVLL